MARLGRGQPNRPVISRTRTSGPAQGTIAVAITLSATGTKHASGSATITAALAFSTTGTKRTGLGLSRRRRPWQFVVGPASGGHTAALTAAKDRRYVARLTEPSELGFSINGRHAQAAEVDELSTDVHVLWTSDAGTTYELDRLRVGSSGDTGDATAHTTSFAALDYREVLKRRILYSGATLTYSATDQGEIAWGLIDYTQGLNGGDLGIAKGWTGTTPTGITRDRTYAEGDSIGERVQELGELIDGFDWDISPSGASALTLEIWHPERGSSRGVVLEYGGLVTGFRREVDPSGYANALRYSGTDGLTAQEEAAAGLAGLAEGRWDAQFGDTDLITQAALNERADWQIEQSQVITPTYTVTLKRGSWEGPDHIWLGDTVRLVVMSGRLAVDTQIRVYEVAVTPGNSGDELIELTLGGPRPDYRRKPRATDRRLSTLERR